MVKSFKILRYEVQRVLFTKPYLLLSLVTAVYSVFILQTRTLYGEYGTAPFSEWSFTAYLLTLMPVLSTMILVYIAKTNDSNERLVQNVTRSTPTPAGKQLMIKYLAIAVGFFVNLLIVVLAAYIFYAVKLKLFAPLNLLLCTFIVALPQLLLLGGVGLWVARLKSGAVYGVIALLFFASAIGVMLPMSVDVLGNSWLSAAESGTLVKGVINFVIPAGYALSRVVISCIGLALVATACLKTKK